MSIVTIIELVAAVIGVPPSIYFLLQLRRNRQKPLQDADLSLQEYLSVLGALQKLPNRVLIHFDKDNVDKEGTFERLVSSFWHEYIKHQSDDIFGTTRLESFLYRPTGVLSSAKLRVSYYHRHWIEAITEGFLLTFLPIFGFANLVGWAFDQSPFWQAVIAVPISIAWLIVSFIAIGVMIYRNNRNVKRSLAALDVVERYVETLTKLEIVVQEEITQSKDKYDEFHGRFEAAVTPVVQLS